MTGTEDDIGRRTFDDRKRRNRYRRSRLVRLRSILRLYTRVILSVRVFKPDSENKKPNRYVRVIKQKKKCIYLHAHDGGRSRHGYYSIRRVHFLGNSVIRRDLYYSNCTQQTTCVRHTPVYADLT